LTISDILTCPLHRLISRFILFITQKGKGTKSKYAIEDIIRCGRIDGTSNNPMPYK
jgi:hypothetical protein